MIIRCERCSTLYELDEGLLSLEGTEVQCARCQHVFTARGPEAPPAAPEPLPSPAAPAAVLERTAPAPAAAAATAPGAASPAPAPGPAPVAPAAMPAPAPVAHRPSVYRPPISQPIQPVLSRPSVLRRDPVGAFGSRRRSSHRWKWVVLLLVAAGGIAAAAFLTSRKAPVDEAALRGREHALSLARADDVRSLEEAAAELDRILRVAPGFHEARADRALVDLLLAGILSDSPTDKTDASARRERARALVTGATAVLEGLRKANLARAEVARALAVAASFAQSRPELGKAARAAMGELPGDPWVAAAEAAADLRSADRTLRERVVGDLGAVVARRPDALRARYLLARGQLLAGRRTEALATVEAVLHANPRHEGALGLRDALGHGVGSPSPAAGASAEAVRVEKPAALPRKVDSTPGEAPAPTPSEPTVASEAPQSAPEHPAEPASAPAEPAASAGAEATQPAEPPLAPRLRPAAVPEPEPVRGGG